MTKIRKITNLAKITNQIKQAITARITIPEDVEGKGAHKYNKNKENNKSSENKKSRKRQTQTNKCLTRTREGGPADISKITKITNLAKTSKSS